MPTHVNDIETLKQYIGGVMGRADHHAKNVNEVTLALLIRQKVLLCALPRQL